MGERWGKQVELFLSTYVNKVDRKGRVSVPATFRSTLASNKTPNQIIIYPSFQLPALECSGSDRMEEMQERIDDYLNFGVHYVWLINPRKRRAFIYRSEGVQEVKDGVLWTANPDLRVSLSELE